MVVTLTKLKGAGPVELPVDVIEDEAITVDNASFATTISIDNRNYTNLLIHINNNGVTNDMDYEILAHGDRNNGVQPTVDNSWITIKASTTIQEDSAVVETLNDRFAWVVIRTKETVATNTTTAKIWIRAASGF